MRNFIQNWRQTKYLRSTAPGTVRFHVYVHTQKRVRFQFRTLLLSPCPSWLTWQFSLTNCATVQAEDSVGSNSTWLTINNGKASAQETAGLSMMVPASRKVQTVYEMDCKAFPSAGFILEDGSTMEQTRHQQNQRKGFICTATAFGSTWVLIQYSPPIDWLLTQFSG